MPSQLHRGEAASHAAVNAEGCLRITIVQSLMSSAVTTVLQQNEANTDECHKA